MGSGRLAVLELAEAERSELTSLAGRRSTAQALALRARIVLACAAGAPNKEVAARLEVAENTVGKWRRRFVEQRLDGLREMAKASGLSTSTVQRIWHAFGLQPHRLETFKLSTDPDFVAKVRDVVGLYVSPPRHAIVLCVDETSQIQALDRSQPMLPMRPGQAAQVACPSDAHQFVLAQPGRAILRPAHRQDDPPRVYKSLADLRADIEAFIDRHNADPKPFRWTKSADDIRASIERPSEP